MENKRRKLPMVALRGMVVMPEMAVHFDISRKKSIEAIQQAMEEEQQIFLSAQKSVEIEEPGQDDIYEVGTIASIRQIVKLPKQIVRVMVYGEKRAYLKQIEEEELYLCAEVEELSLIHLPGHYILICNHRFHNHLCPRQFFFKSRITAGFLSTQDSQLP